MTVKERVKSLVFEMGFHACGITSPEVPPEARGRLKDWVNSGKHGGMGYLEDYEKREKRFKSRFPEPKSVIVVGVNYFSSASGKENKNLSGRVARYARGKDYHRLIRNRLETLQERIESELKGAVWFESAVDTKPVLERSLAERAGLGFRGKQTQLLSLQFGPWLFLAELFTDLALEPDQPFSGSCGTCRLCIDACPTEAIEETGGLDARNCISYLTIEHKKEIPVELRPKIGDHVFGCDDCLDICPYTAKQKETDWAELTADGGFGPALDLEPLVQIKSNREYERYFGQTAISRAQRKQLMRNACVVLGNSGNENALPFLNQALQDSSAMVQEHARWAIERIQKENNHA